MKRALLAGVAAIAFCSNPTFAADMPVKAAPAPAAPLFNWSGFYVGGHAGGVWFKDDFHVDIGPTGTLRGDGFIGGALAGYNVQSGNWVFGIEGDGGWTSADTSTRSGIGGPGLLKAEMNWDSHLRARVGLAQDRLLWFAAGGVAWANFTQPAPIFASPNQTHTGWTIGGGVDWAFASNWIGRVEYLFTSYDSKTYNYASGGGGTIRSSYDTNTVRAALIYKFGGDPWGKGPVVAKY